MRAALLAFLLAFVPPARAAQSVLGFNFPDWSRDGYASAGAARGLAEIKATGAGWVALTPTVYMKDRRGSSVAATDQTPDDAALIAAIRAAHAAGLKVVLKPHVDRLDGGARAWISPKDPAAWFASYRTFLLGYARIAREENCDLFVVGTELSFLTEPRHWKAWRALIRDARAAYPGPLTYAGNWHSMAHVGFWKDLDYIGVDAYYPAVGGTNRTVLRAGLLPAEAELKALSAVNGRPILFTEFGLASQKGANLKPWEWRDFGAADPEVQAAYLDAFFATFAGKSWVAGFLNWAWDADASHGGPQDKSMSLRGKPALAEFERVLDAGKPVLPPPTPSLLPVAARAAAVMSGAAALGR